MSKRVKQYLMLFAALGVVAVALGGGSGTFASFNAVVSNDNNVFATGTLFLHNTAGVTTCTSESAGNNANLGTGDSCAAIFNVTAANGAAGTTYYQVALKNAGTIDASGIDFYANSACTPTTLGVSNGTASGGSGTTTISVSGGVPDGMPASTLIQVGSSAQVHTVGLTSAGDPTITVDAPVTFTNGDTVTFFPTFSGSISGNGLCDAVDVEVWDMGTSSTLSQTPSSVIGASCVYGCSPTKKLSDLPGSGSPQSMGVGLASSATRYVEIGVVKPDLDNSYQSQQAKLSLAWKIVE